MAKTPPTGLETDVLGAADRGAADVVRSVSFDRQHLRLTAVAFRDQSDVYNELVQEQEYLLHPSERALELRGNLFVVEDLAAGTGRILLRETALPHVRSEQGAGDLRLEPHKGTGFTIQLLSAGMSETADAWHVLEYSGGRPGRTRVLHAWQRAQRPDTASHRVPRFLTNTWGDRSKDLRICAAFMAQEIDAAARLGAEVVQIDLGWQLGVTKLSKDAARKGGVWEGYWRANPEFWTPDPNKFPDGLEPLVARAAAAGVEIGLWFGPDSHNEFENWRRDVDCLLDLFRRHGIRHFKLDGIMAPTPTARDRLHQLLRALIEESAGALVCDLDITAQLRPGYFGAVPVGPLFVENRYTDTHRYWPHQTLRNLWKLAAWIDPLRLRMELLNNARNTERYPDDPLAPEKYTPDTLFATVLCSNPLGWFEVSNLPESYFATIPPLVAAWKEHRAALFEGTILPVGGAPDGFAWTGFVSIDQDSQCRYVLAFRELSPEQECRWRVPGLQPNGQVEILGGAGTVQCEGDTLVVSVEQTLGFVFARLG